MNSRPSTVHCASAPAFDAIVDALRPTVFLPALHVGDVARRVARRCRAAWPCRRAAARAGCSARAGCAATAAPARVSAALALVSSALVASCLARRLCHALRRSRMALRASSSSNKPALRRRAAAAASTSPAHTRAEAASRGETRHSILQFGAAVLGPAASSWPSLAGRSLPKLTASIWPSCAPSSIIDLATASARRWPSARLYSRPPRSSVWPSMHHLLGLAALSAARVAIDQRLVFVACTT